MQYKTATEEFMTVREASVEWGISQRRVAILCADGRVPASRFNSAWAIPRNYPKPIDGRTVRYNQPLQDPIKPFLKWAGGKGQLLQEICKYYPFDSVITKYVEPMVGGGAVLFDILGKYDLDEIYINDVNMELMDTYIVVKSRVGDLMELLKRYQEEYIPMDREKRKQYYLDKRNRFNELIDTDFLGDKVEKASLMIFLNKTCFNGLYRVNAKGLFNVPMGVYKNPLICDEGNLKAISEKLKKVKIYCGDYRSLRKFIDKHTFVYFDPPYRPLTVTAGFTAYNSGGFGDEQQKELAEFVHEMDKKGALVIINNSVDKQINLLKNFER
ncbi:MAG: Dam family site-specific DNA-(adenine-N6)-methyltransferase [Acidaminococcaceae bacterium]|nr:Dam family site-specific DNA-(adenine-N6)-methyltransferase [Acidaminococcaceae bacterium]